MNINKIAEIINKKGYKVEVQEITKGSTTKIGLTIGTGSVRPTIYPDQFTADDFTDDQIADKVIEIYEHNKTPEFDIEQITSADYIKNNLIVSVRRPMEDEAFTKSYLDIQLVLRVKIDDNASFKVTKEMAEQFGIIESAFDEAIRNMKFNFRPMGSIIEDMTDEEIPDVVMYVISDDSVIFGAAAMYDKYFLKSMADLLNSDLVIIPSSTHEIIVIKYDETTNIDQLNEMVKAINFTEVSPEEQLSDHVYIFTKENSTISF